MSKLIEFLELDEIGSNYLKEVYDPHGFPEDAFFDRIGRAGLMAMIASVRLQLRTPLQLKSKPPVSLQLVGVIPVRTLRQLYRKHNNELFSSYPTSTKQ